MFLFATVFSLALGPGGPCTGLGFKLGPLSPHLWFDLPDPRRCGDSPPPWGRVMLRLGLLGQHWREEPAGSQRGLSVPVGGAGLGLHSTRSRWGGGAVGAQRSRGLTTSPGTAAQGPGIMGGRLSLGPTAVPACNPSGCPTARESSVDGGGPLTRPSAPRLQR